MRGLDFLLRDYCIRIESVCFPLVFKFFSHSEALYVQLIMFIFFLFLLPFMVSTSSLAYGLKRDPYLQS